MTSKTCASLVYAFCATLLIIRPLQGLPFPFSLTTSGGEKSSFTLSSSSSIIENSARKNVQRFEEYMVEHEVSSTQAKNSALTIDPESLFVPFSCDKCNEAEIKYCESDNFVHDHCCCDRRFHEYLSYIPHTCYFGKQLCRPIIGHCDDYTKLRRCCCDPHVLKYWKSKSSAGIRIDHLSWIILSIILLLHTQS